MNPLLNDVDDKHKERGRNEPECIFHVLVITLMLLSGIHGPVQITAIILEIQFFNRFIFHVAKKQTQRLYLQKAILMKFHYSAVQNITWHQRDLRDRYDSHYIIIISFSSLINYLSPQKRCNDI